MVDRYVYVEVQQTWRTKCGAADALAATNRLMSFNQSNQKIRPTML